MSNNVIPWIQYSMKLKGFAPKYTSNGLHTIKGLALVLLVVHMFFFVCIVFFTLICAGFTVRWMQFFGNTVEHNVNTRSCMKLILNITGAPITVVFMEACGAVSLFSVMGNWVYGVFMLLRKGREWISVGMGGRRHFALPVQNPRLQSLSVSHHSVFVATPGINCIHLIIQT